MAEIKKYISTATHLQGLALFLMAKDHYLKAKEYESAMAELLEFDDENYCGCLSDQFYETSGNFDRGLKLEGIGVREPAQKRKR